MSDKPFTPTVNKNVPQVGEPVADIGSLLTVAKSLKQGIESLGGYRGEMSGRAVTFLDLVGLGLVPPTTFNLPSGTGTGGIATNSNLEQETSARKAADQNLQASVDAEEAARAAADGVLAAEINTEEAARVAADNAEAATRAAADGALQGEIDAEENIRLVTDIDLQNQINALAIPVVTFAGLPGSPVVGKDAVVTDSTVNTWGAAVTTGGGAFVVKAWWNGGAWKVSGI